MSGDTRPGREDNSWLAVGGVLFAASMMVLVGVFQFFTGLAALVDDQFYVVNDHYAFNLDVTAWGWIHLILGIVVAVSGAYLFAGRPWAAAVAIVIVILSAISNFFLIPYYPFWAILVIAIEVFVLWALTRPGVATA
jgi:hypothetical protein